MIRVLIWAMLYLSSIFITYFYKYALYKLYFYKIQQIYNLYNTLIKINNTNPKEKNHFPSHILNWKWLTFETKKHKSLGCGCWFWKVVWWSVEALNASDPTKRAMCEWFRWVLVLFWLGHMSIHLAIKTTPLWFIQT